MCEYKMKTRIYATPAVKGLKSNQSNSLGNTKHLYNIYTMLDLGRRYINVIQIFCVYWERVSYWCWKTVLKTSGKKPEVGKYAFSYRMTVSVLEGAQRHKLFLFVF